jgi:hypothetical protein
MALLLGTNDSLMWAMALLLGTNDSLMWAMALLLRTRDSLMWAMALLLRTSEPLMWAMAPLFKTTAFFLLRAKAFLPFNARASLWEEFAVLALCFPYDGVPLAGFLREVGKDKLSAAIATLR